MIFESRVARSKTLVREEKKLSGPQIVRRCDDCRVYPRVVITASKKESIECAVMEVEMNHEIAK